MPRYLKSAEYESEYARHHSLTSITMHRCCRLCGSHFTKTVSLRVRGRWVKRNSLSEAIKNFDDVCCMGYPKNPKLQLHKSKEYLEALHLIYLIKTKSDEIQNNTIRS